MMDDLQYSEKYKLEPESMGCSYYYSAHSIAISLKRIADMMERNQVTVSGPAEWDWDWVRTSSCPSCDGLNVSCPEGCGRNEEGELDGSTLVRQ